MVSGALLAGGGLALDGGVSTELERTQLLSAVVYEEKVQVPVDSAAHASQRMAESAGRTVSPTATGCWTMRADYHARAAAGNTLYTAWHVGYWCSDGNTITDARTLDSGGETRTPYWSYEGPIDGGAGVWQNEARSFTKLRFVHGIPGKWQIQSPTPCIRVIGSVNGSGKGDDRCSVEF
ncbi:hypothetical protein [Rhodococcus spongiicola]|uniref:Uncharacterized protein n=1 Tax=Rhodococcus spongiicola TaxID=2487352 RepID=A0A3S3A2Y8_9NOCA|nr:hypothetical protein [Rhodococcus spongiicola]RVW00874.1 hypothetical protein EF834_15905 [Rhodococcus spongiicola]